MMNEMDRLGQGGKSICSCGHLGDGVNSQHQDTFQAGHGRCRMPGCDCSRFTWVAWNREIATMIANTWVNWQTVKVEENH